MTVHRHFLTKIALRIRGAQDLNPTLPPRIPTMKHRSRSVIGTVALLLAVALGIAVELVKESGDRSQCEQNLKQIGLALWNYES
jgi:hypothetical protein